MKKGLFIVALAATVSVLSSTAFSQDLSNNPAYKNGTEWLANPVANPVANAEPAITNVFFPKIFLKLMFNYLFLSFIF